MPKIKWTKTTWNIVTGCTKCSPGCNNCYAGFDKVVCHGECLTEPYRWKKQRLVFVNSMSDTFHTNVENCFIKRMLATIQDNKRHTFQILTKRPTRFIDFSFDLPNLWLGVTIENNVWTQRAEALRETEAPVKFISFEPLLGPIKKLRDILSGIDWVIVGGETGPNRRVMGACWAYDIYQACKSLSIPFYYKKNHCLIDRPCGIPVDDFNGYYKMYETKQMPKCWNGGTK